MLIVKYVPVFLIAFFIQEISCSVFAGGCEVVSYTVYEEKDKHISCNGIVSFTERQCADLTVRSLSSVGHQLKDLSVKAVFEDQTYEIRKIKTTNSNDTAATIIGAGERFNGRACFKIRPRIVQVECSIN